MKRARRESEIGTAKMEASRSTKGKDAVLDLNGMESEPFDQLALDILAEYPQAIPDLKKTLVIVHEKAERLGILPDYEIEGAIDIEYPEMRSVWVRLHVGRRMSSKRMVRIWSELTELILPELQNDVSIRVLNIDVVD